MTCTHMQRRRVNEAERGHGGGGLVSNKEQKLGVLWGPHLVPGSPSRTLIHPCLSLGIPQKSLHFLLTVDPIYAAKPNLNQKDRLSTFLILKIYPNNLGEVN